MPPAKLVLLSLPLATVAVVSFALYVVGAPRTYLGARVYGGPTEGATRLSLRVAVVERTSELELPASIGALAVEADLSDGRNLVREASTDELGMASIDAPVEGAPIRGPVRIRVSRPGARGALLAQGSAELAVAEWAAKKREHGGWLTGAKSGELVVRVAPGRGAFAVPFADPLWIEVHDAKGPVSGAKITLEGDGIEPVGAQPADTSPRGRTLVNLSPRDNVASLRVIATGEAGARGEWYGSVPIAVGALRGSASDGHLKIESAVPVTRAYWCVQSERARLVGGVAALAPDGHGGAVATVPLPALPHEKLWAVVSGEPELDALSTVGWPLEVPDFDAPLAVDPPMVRAVQDELLLDGLVSGRLAEVERRRQARFLALGFSVLAAGLAALLFARDARGSAERLERHLREAGAGEQATEAIALRRSRWIGVVVALVSMAMGFAVVALVALYRMR